MPAQAGKLSSGRNGGYTRPKGPFHPVEGQGVNCPLPGPRAPASLGGETVSTSQEKQFGCTVCEHITAELAQFVCLYSVVYCMTKPVFFNLDQAKANTFVFVLD